MKQSKRQNGAGKLSKQNKKRVKYPEKNEVSHAKKSRHSIRRQRNKNMLITAVLVAVLFAILVFISLKVLFIVQKVEIVGTERYMPEEITAYCRIPYEESIFKIDTDGYEKGLYDEFVYIDSVSVKRRLPNKILIEITDSTPTYYSPQNDTYTIYSQSFKKLTSRAQKPETLMGIEADLSNEEIKSTLQQVIDAVKEGGYENITLISVADISDIVIVYDDRISIKFGTVLDIDYKLKMAFHLIENEISDGEKGQINITEAGKAIFTANG